MDAHHYNACVGQWSDALYRFALKCTGAAADAQDVVQGSFEVLWQKRAEVEPEKGKAFLFQVAYRQSVNAHRHRRRHLPQEAAADEGDARHPGNPDLRRLLDAALARLDEQARGLVLLKDYEGYRYEEIAQITGLSETQVKVYLHRARKSLKSFLVTPEHLL